MLMAREDYGLAIGLWKEVGIDVQWQPGRLLGRQKCV